MTIPRPRLLQHFGDIETTEVAEMYDKFNFTLNLDPTVLPKDVMLQRARFIRDELDELFHAVDREDFVEAIDALIDIVVVAKGTGAMMGIQWRKHWEEVHRANKQKERGKNPKRPHMDEDLIKPEGWVGPNHESILGK